MVLELFDGVGLSAGILAFLVGAAFLGGFIDSIAGGGGLITLPATLLAGVPPHETLGSNKFLACCGTAAAFATYARSGQIVWRVVVVGVGFCFLGSALGAQLVLFLDKEILGKILVVFLPSAAFFVMFPMRRSGGATLSARRLYIAVPPVCFCLGLYDGFFGPGAGSFFLLALYAIVGLGLVQATATTKALNLTTNISALIVYVIHGQVLYAVAIPMAIGNIAGNVIGSRLAIARGAPIVRRVLVCSLLLLFCTLIWQYFFKPITIS